MKIQFLKPIIIKSVFLLTLFLLVFNWLVFPIPVLAASHTYSWTYTFGSSSDDYAFGVPVDSDDNVYLIGHFEGANTEFNTTGSGSSDKHTSNGNLDIYVTKYNSDGSYGWTYTFGSASDDYSYASTTDLNDNVYVSGSFQGANTEFNTTGSGSSDQHTSNGDLDASITKYNADGSYGWTYTFGSADADYGGVINTDSSGNIYFVGYFKGADVEFNTTGSGSSDQHTSNGDFDIFITKYNSDGSYGWTYTMGSADADYATGVTTDSNDNVYLSSSFQGANTEYNTTGSGSSDKYTSNGDVDTAITKYNSDGSYGWTYTFGSTGTEYGRAITTDSNDNIYFSSLLDGSNVEFNTTGSGSSDIHSSNGGNGDIAITKYKSDGSYDWTYTIGGTSGDWPTRVVTDYLGNIYLCGWFAGTNIEFNTTGSGSSDQHTATGGDSFLTRYNSDGSYAWTYTFGDRSRDVSADSVGNIYLAGNFDGSNVEFNTTGSGSSDKHSTIGNDDVFFTKYLADRTAPSLSFISSYPEAVNQKDFSSLYKGRATETQGTVESVSWQMDSSTGTWSSCTADNGSFDETTEDFSCNIDDHTFTAEGNHTLYFRTEDPYDNTTNTSVPLVVDWTLSSAFSLVNPLDDSLLNNSYSFNDFYPSENKVNTNSSRPTFKWRATSKDTEKNTNDKTDEGSGIDKYTFVLEKDLNYPNSGGTGGVDLSDWETVFKVEDITFTPFKDKLDSDKVPYHQVETDKYILEYQGFHDDLLATFDSANYTNSYDNNVIYFTTKECIPINPDTNQVRNCWKEEQKNELGEITNRGEDQGKLTGLGGNSYQKSKYKWIVRAYDKAGNIREEDRILYYQPSSFSSSGVGGVLGINTNEDNLKILEVEEVPVETEEEKKKVEEEGYTVSLKVLDQKNQPLSGAKVELHSDPIYKAKTDKQGNVSFNNVSPGKHTIKVAYRGYKGEEGLELTGDTTKEYKITLQLEMKSPFLNLLVIILFGLVIILGGSLVYKNLKLKEKK